MATYEEHIEGLTQIDINTTSAPTTTELTNFLVEGLISTVNRITSVRPDEVSKFTKTTNATSSISKKGKLISVNREHDSTDILRPCTPINPALRYLATDVDSLHYRSKYNPGFYERDGSVHCVPQAASGNNDIVVTQVHYDTGLVAGDTYNAGNVENFPIDYEHLISLYASSHTCQAAAADIQNNLPTKPFFSGTLPDNIPVLDDARLSRKVDSIPEFPNFVPPTVDVNYQSATIAINNEDFDKAEQHFKIIEKELEKFDKKLDIAQKKHENSIVKFTAQLELISKNTENLMNIETSEYKTKLEKYASDIGNYANKIGLYNAKVSEYGAEVGKYTQELQEKISKYNWYVSQSSYFMQQYNGGIVGAPPPPESQRGE